MVKSFTLSYIGKTLKNLHIIYCRLNALEYRELKDKLQAPVRNARDIVIIQSLSEQFLQAFAEQITQNPAFNLPEEMVGERMIIYLDQCCA